eukprot:m.22209 g.22209  ORF g.22209 m.22209 type:complete len:208 (-) comp9268_c0_seq1:208-831(-)
MKMKAMLIAIFSAVVLAVCVSAQSRCEMPQEWEARTVRFDPNRRPYLNHSSDYRTWGRYAYDGIDLRKWMLDEVVLGGGDNPKRYMVLELYREQQVYVTDLSNYECKIYDLTHRFHRHDINPNATFIGNEILGFGQDQILLSQWFANDTTYHGEPSTDYQTFTMNCVPVRDDHYTEETGFHYEEFSDVTLGISDPNIWIPSPSCKFA